MDNHDQYMSIKQHILCASVCACVLACVRACVCVHAVRRRKLISPLVPGPPKSCTFAFASGQMCTHFCFLVHPEDVNY